MDKENKKVNKEGVKAKVDNANNSKAPASKKPFNKDKAGGGKRFARKKNFSRRRPEQDEFEQRIVDIARVTRVMKGGKRMRFRACVAVGNKKGKIAIGVAKGADVTIAVTKAVSKAKKDITDVPIVNDTIPHEIYMKTGAAKILFKPARKGRGVIAGGAVRIILELAGIKNITSKILGTNNKLNNSKCVIEALRNLKRVETPAKDKKKDMKKKKEATGKKDKTSKKSDTKEK